MKRDTYYRPRRPKVFPAGRICSGEECAVILSTYNPDTVCARCDKAQRAAQWEAERLAFLLEEATRA